MQNKKGIAIGIIVIIVLLGGAIAWLFLSGRLVLTDPGNTQSASSYRVVCDEEMVTAYNAAAYFEVRDGLTQPTLDEAGLEAIKTDITQSSGYESDPTCQTILFWMAVDDGDYEAAKTAYDTINNLYAQRLFADSNLRTNGPVFTHEQALYNISPEGIEAESEIEGVGDSA